MNVMDMIDEKIQIHKLTSTPLKLMAYNLATLQAIPPMPPNSASSNVYHVNVTCLKIFTNKYEKWDNIKCEFI